MADQPRSDPQPARIRWSAFGAHFTRRQNTDARSSSERLILRQVPGRLVAEINAYAGREPALRSGLGDLLGGESRLPPSNMCARTEGARVIALGPGRLWVVHGPGGSIDCAVLAAALEEATATVTDLSAARQVMGIDGVAAVHVLNRYVRLDLADARFAVDRVAATLFGHVAVVLHRVSASGYELYIPSSFAETVAGELTKAASSVDCRIE